MIVQDAVLEIGQSSMTDREYEENQALPPASSDVGDSKRTTPNVSCSHRAWPDGFALRKGLLYTPLWYNILIPALSAL